MKTSCLASALALLAACQGCATPSSNAPPTNVARPLLYAAPADRVQTSTLLDFENALDSTFVDASAVRLAEDPTHAGNRALVAEGGVRLNLTSLTRGRDVGGAWDVFGMRVWSDAATTCDVTVIGPPMAPAQPLRFNLAAHAWTNIWMDAPGLSPHPPTSTATQTGDRRDSDRFVVVISQSVPQGHLLIDEVALAKSRVVVSESNVPKTNEHWSVLRRGMQWMATVNDVTLFSLPAAPFVPGGYRVSSADPTRVLFANEADSNICIDRTGRLIEDGHAKLDPRVLKFAKAIAENASPALVEIVDNEGRLERSLPGDHDNDGYDETRGCYSIHAIAGRATLRLTKQRATVKWPVLEVFDLPPGPVSVWVDGEIVPWAIRTEDGRTMVELPIELERPVEVQIRVR